MAADLAQKLLLRPGNSFLVLDSPSPDYIPGPLPPEVEVRTSARGTADVVLLYAPNKAALVKRAPVAFRATKPGGLCWIAYRKGGAKAGTDINRDSLWRALDGSGWRPVTQVALDGTWSALRFRPAAEVGAR